MLNAVTATQASPPADPRHQSLRQLRLRRTPRECGPCTVESIRSAIDACNLARQQANALLGVEHFPMQAYPLWMTEETR